MNGRSGSSALWVLACVAAMIVSLVAGPAFAGGGQGGNGQGGSGGTQDIPIDDGCPPLTTDTTGDGDGDGVDHDTLLHTQNDTAGGKLELWCIDPDGVPSGPGGGTHDEYYALVYVDPSGGRHFIGKCPFEGGQNNGNKTHNETGGMENITWRSIDEGNFDDDQDGANDTVIYNYSVESGNLTIKHLENGTVVNETPMTPPTGRFNFSSIPPKDPSDQNWDVEDGSWHPLFGQIMGPQEWTVAGLRVIATWQGTGLPAVGRMVTVMHGGVIAAQGETGPMGKVRFSLETGAYIVMVEGADPTPVALEEPTNVPVTVSPEVHGSVPALPLSAAVAAVAAAAISAIAIKRRRG